MMSGGGGGDQFPVGLRVLVVDDDVTCLKILDHMLQRCRYRVTTCCQATVALSLLREKRGSFDVVISDVHMPDMNGFKLLELVGLEMDLPVIMMSADGGTHTVMRGIKHGACDYLIKPVRIEELKNIWQHVLRKKWSGNRELDYSGSMDDSDRNRRVADEADIASSVNDGSTDGSWKSHKKKRDSKEDEDDGELDHEDPSLSKKPRVVWSVELHQQFVSAVSQLGIEKAVPKRILELMNVPGLTRENVASHLQKFRLYLKRISSVAQHQNGLPSSLLGPLESNAKVGSAGRLDFQALAASGQIPPQTLAALHAEFLGHPSGSLVLPAIDQPVLQASRQGSKCTPPEREITFGQPLFKCQSKQFPSTGIAGENVSAGFSLWSSNQPGKTDSIKSLGGVNGNMMIQMLQRRRQQQQQSFPVLSDSHHAINVQPSCLIVPPRSTSCLNIGKSSLPINQNSIVVSSQLCNSFQSGNGSVAINASSSFGSPNIVLDYSSLPSLSNNSLLGVGQTSDGDVTNIGVSNGSPGSISSSVSSCSACTNSDSGWQLQNPHTKISSATGLPVNPPNLCSLGSEPKTGGPSDQGQARSLGFVGKGTCIPSRFAMDDIESPSNDQSSRNTVILDGGRVKQEFHLDFPDSSQSGTVILPSFSSNNFTGVLSKLFNSQLSLLRYGLEGSFMKP